MDARQVEQTVGAVMKATMTAAQWAERVFDTLNRMEVPGERLRRPSSLEVIAAAVIIAGGGFTLVGYAALATGKVRT